MPARIPKAAASSRGKKQPPFTVVHVPINTLKPAAYNPRKASEKEVEDVRKSLAEFGFVDPIVANSHPTRKNVVIGGHLRLRVALAMGMTSVPVHWVSLTEDRERELNLRLNKNTGAWDWDVLADFDASFLLSAGFTSEELAFNFDLDAGSESDDDEPPAPPDDPVSRTGDLWVLGEHRVTCGDSTDAACVARLMGDERAALLFTDPPYGVNIGAKNVFLNTFQKAGRNLTAVANDALGKDALFSMLTAAFSIAREALADTASFYVTAPQNGGLGLMMMMMMMMMMMEAAGLPPRHTLIWVKSAPTFSMGRLDYDYQHEPIMYGWKKSHKFRGNGAHKSSVWQIDKPRESKAHPTMKPIALIANAVSNSSVDGDLVLDIFGGSGSTLIACENLRRRCRMVELEARYVDVIVRRWQDATGKVATLDGGGAFAEVAEQRASASS